MRITNADQLRRGMVLTAHYPQTHPNAGENPKPEKREVGVVYKVSDEQLAIVYVVNISGCSKHHTRLISFSDFQITSEAVPTVREYACNWVESTGEKTEEEVQQMLSDDCLVTTIGDLKDETQTIHPASIADVTRLAKQIKDNWTLCNFLDKCEAEYMVAETIHAAAINAKEHGEPFSFRGPNVRGRDIGGCVDNNAGYQMLLDQGLIVEDERLGKPVIFPTVKLVKKLDGFLA